MKKQITKVLFESSKEVTDAMKERGAKQILRLAILIDVLYALILYKLLMNLLALRPTMLN